MGVRPDDVGVSWLPLYHDMGLIGAWLAPLYFGLPVVVLSPLAFLSRPERWLWALHRHRGTLTAAPNFAYELAVRKIADSDIEGLDLSALRAALNGAEPVLAETLERFAERFARYGFRREAFAPVYGLAEASLALTIPPPGRGPRVDRVAREPFAREGRAIPAPPGSSADDASVTSFVSVGAALPEHEIRIVDSAGHDVGERIEGALWFRGPSATSGYFRNPDASAKLFPEGQAAGWIDSGRSRVPGRWRDLYHRAREGHHPQGRPQPLSRTKSRRSRDRCRAFAGDAWWPSARRTQPVAPNGSSWWRKRAKQGRAARQRIARAITEQVALAIGLPPDVVELLRPHSIPKTSSGKLRREETRRLYLAGSSRRGAPLRHGCRWSAWPPPTRRERRSPGPGAHSNCCMASMPSIVFVLWIIPTWMLVALAPSRRVAERITTWGLRLLFVLIGCRIRMVGREHLETPPPRVFVSNHTSYFDVLVLMAALGSDYHFVAKSEVHNMLFIGTFLRRLGHFAFDRSDPQARVRQAEEIEAALGRGESVFVFPEGTFRVQDGVRAFHLGAFRAAVAARCPVIPVALGGTRQFLRDRTYLPRPASITLTICPPLAPAPSAQSASWQDVVRLRDAARAAISLAAGEPLV